MIFELLGYGKDAALTASELSQLTGLPERRVTRLIERERRAGTPICASSGSACKGYYLASTPDELEQYTRALNRRIRTITDGLDALITIRDKLSGQLSMHDDGGLNG